MVTPKKIQEEANKRFPNIGGEISDEGRKNFIEGAEFAASLNRQGCRWTKASERLPEADGKYFVRYVESKTRNFIDLEYIKESPSSYEWLDESIEPCADQTELEKIAEALNKEVYQYIQWHTSNSNKQPSFQGCHDAMDRFSDWQKSKIEPCATSSDWEKFRERIEQTELLGSAAKMVVLAFIDQYLSPSPTGDRDCEELKWIDHQDELVAWLTTFDSWTKMEAFRFVEKMSKVFDIKKK